MKVLEVYKQNLRNRRYSDSTIEVYTCYLEKFLIHQKVKDPYQISLKQIQDYLLYRSYSSSSQQNQIIGSLKLFAKYILGKAEVNLTKIERPRKAKKLPMVIDGQMLKEKILAIKNLKHRALLALGFSCGLRVSEVIQLKPSCIDRQRMRIHIKAAKGQKDRFVKMSQPLLLMLEQYYRAYKPYVYMFNGHKNLLYSATSCNKLVKRYIHPKAHFHTLRHSYATYVHENGTDIATLSASLGHSSVKTTMIYTHISARTLQSIVSPI